MRALLLLALVPLLYVQQVNAQVYLGKSNTIAVDFADDPPELVWLSPEKDGMTLDDKKLKVKLGINSSVEIVSIVLTVNDVVQGGSRGVSIVENTEGYDDLFEKEVRLKVGLNELSVLVKNDNGDEVSSFRSVYYSGGSTIAAIESKRTDYALIIGTNEYEEWPDLTNPVFDSKTIAKELEDNYGFEVEILENPDRREILTTLREYAKKSYLPEDQLFIFIAGHGQFDEITKTGYIATTESKLNDEVKETYLSHSVLRDVVNNIPCNHILLTMDACFGGTFDPVIARAGSRGVDMDDYELTKSEFISRKLKFKTRRYLTSGGKEYVPDGRPGHHSPFARKLLEAFRNYGGNDGILTMTEMGLFLERLEQMPRSGEFGDNEPGSDFVFIAR